MNLKYNHLLLIYNTVQKYKNETAHLLSLSANHKTNKLWQEE